MPTRVCPRCSRVNPAQALFCYNDGAPLQATAAAVAAVVVRQLSQEYVFPSRRRCRTIDDFVQGCHYEWEDARDALRRGEFTRYFALVGRADLARSAEEASAHPDADIGLYNFLSTLPVSQVQGPTLDLNPRRVVLGKMRPGDVKEFQLFVLNRGKGLLQGKISVSEGGQWLRLEGGKADPDGQCALKTANNQTVVLRIDTRGLAAPQSYTGRLTVVTNGGISEVPVRLDLGTAPFGLPPFQGAATPREMAERMKGNPKAAVPLLESGEIQRWFAANGWNYPVHGVPARGVASVQQFFEAMGLSKPPPVQLSEAEIHCLCVPPEVAQRQVILFTQTKKWVYAQVDTDVHWLRVITPNVSGAQQTPIAFEVDSSLMDEGKVHEGRLQVVANAGQTLWVRVRVNVRKPHRPFTRRLFGPFFKVALVALLYRCFLAVPSDLYARIPGETFAREVLTDPDKERTPPSLLPKMAEVAGKPGDAVMFLPLDDESVDWIAAQRWTWPPTEEDGYLARFILATFWIFSATVIWQVWKRRSQWSDIPSGIVAGLMAGIVLAATAACVMAFGDFVPRLAMSGMDGGPLSVFLLLALLWWTLVGASVGFLLAFFGGRAGLSVVQGILWPVGSLCRMCGLAGAASFFP